MKYTIKELKHFRDVFALALANDYYDDQHGSPRDFFNCETNRFFDRLEKMEKRKNNKI